MRAKLLLHGPSVLPKSWQRKWMMQRIIATPPWVDMREIRPFYDEAARLTQETGSLHTVDHEIPLNHPYVCGLHVPCNLRVMPYKANYSKGNNWNEDQLSLF